MEEKCVGRSIIQLLHCVSLIKNIFKPIPVAARSRGSVCGRSPAEIVGSNPTGVAWMSVVSVVCCQVEVSATG